MKNIKKKQITYNVTLMIKVQQGIVYIYIYIYIYVHIYVCVYVCIYHIDVYRFWKIKQLRNMKKVDPESIRDFMKCGVLLKWTHNNGDMNLSEVIMYFIVDSIINVFYFVIETAIQKGMLEL